MEMISGVAVSWTTGCDDSQPLKALLTFEKKDLGVCPPRYFLHFRSFIVKEVKKKKKQNDVLQVMGNPLVYI